MRCRKKAKGRVVLVVFAVFFFLKPSGLPVAAAGSEETQQEINLEEAIKIALANNPDLAVAQHELLAAQSREKFARGACLPKVTAGVDYTRFLDNQRLIPARYNGETGLFSRDISSGGLTFSVPLFTAGRLKREFQVAQLLSEVLRERQERLRDEVIFNVSHVFYTMLAQMRLIASLEFSRQALQEHRDHTEQLVAARKAAGVDLLRTEVRLADIQQRMVREKNNLFVLERILANLLGLGETNKHLLPQGKLMEEIPVLMEEQEAISLALNQRADYRAAKYEAEAQSRRVTAARAELWPTVILVGNYGYRWALDSGSNAGSSKRLDDTGSLKIAVEVPVFDGSRIRSRIREEEEKAAAALQRLRKLELQIRLDVQTALANARSAQERVETTKKVIEQARESLRIERQKYDFGKGTISDVLDAQAALLEAEAAFSRALADVNIAHIQFSLATGKVIQ